MVEGKKKEINKSLSVFLRELVTSH